MVIGKRALDFLYASACKSGRWQKCDLSLVVTLPNTRTADYRRSMIQKFCAEYVARSLALSSCIRPARPRTRHVEVKSFISRDFKFEN